jgi:RiboL-PSP-HEPN
MNPLKKLPSDVQKRVKYIHNLAPDEQKRVRIALEHVAKTQIDPYLQHVTENSDRALRLINMYIARLHKRSLAKAARDGSEDILRAVVVLTHASLEDFLRTLAERFLPYADEKILNNVPLAGLNGRIEKFGLGKLIQHKGKSIDALIRESVQQHLSRSNYNDVQEIASLLESLGFDLSEHRENFPKIDAMIKRRHQIVHRGDKVKSGDSEHSLAPMNLGDVMEWTKATYAFMFSLFPSISERQIDLQLKQKALDLNGTDEQ